MHKSSTFSMLFTALLSIGVGASIFAYNTTTTPLQGEVSHPAKRHILQPRLADDGIFSSSTSLENKEMTCYITAAAKTEASVTVTAQFTIGSYVEWGDRDSSIYFVIEDADWSGDRSAPSLSDTPNPSFSGYVSQIKGESSKFTETFVIPEEMTYGSRFSVKNERIPSGVLDFSTLANVTVTRIVIPSTVTTIEADAFVNVPDTVTLSCVANSKPSGWATNWTDATNIEFGYNDANVLTKRNLSVSTGINTIEHSVEYSYILGYVNKPDANYYNPSFVVADLPLIAEYNVLSGNAAQTIRTEINLLDVDVRNSPFDAVGDIGSASISITVDIFLEEGQIIDYESFAFYNIYKAKRDSQLQSYCCDTSEPFYKAATKRFDKEINISDVVNCRFSNVSTFAGYTLVTMNVDKAVPLYYENAAKSIIADNQEKIDSGVYRIRYAIYNLSHSSYRITYNVNGEDKISKFDISTPLPVIELNNDSGNTISFIVKNSEVGPGFSASALKEFEILDLTINMHLWNNDNNSIVGRTAKSVSFGIVDVMPYQNNGVKNTNLNLVLIIVYIIYVVLYAAITAVLYFYLKNKYKNDEFKRIKPKKFFKNAAIGFVGLAEVLLAVMGLIYRTSLFRNSLAAFNPSDVLVVIAGIVALIIIGYFIKYIVGLVKAEKTRRENKRLKLID